MTAQEDVRAFLVTHVGERLTAVGVEPGRVPDDFDLVAEGVLDSLALIELIGALEDRFGVEVDLEGLDAEAFGIMGPFSQYIADQISSTTTPQ